MNRAFARRLTYVASLLLLHTQIAAAAQDGTEVRAYVNDSCIVADEPYYVPVTASTNDQATKSLLLGLVVGKLTELILKYVIGATATHISSGAERKDTRYAVTREMNLYRADLQPSPTLRLNAQLGCMTIVAARFPADKQDCTASYLPKELARETMNLPQDQWQTTRTDDSLQNQLRRANICVDGQPDAVYEARFEFSEDGTTYRLTDAGYRVHSLFDTSNKQARRSVLYTLEISEPGNSEQREKLSTAWVNIGTVTASDTPSAASGEASSPWLRVPTLSIDARRAYEEKTRLHHEVAGEIEAAGRAITRNQRLMVALQQRIDTAASPEVAEGLKQQRLKSEVQIQTLQAEIEARKAEYSELPQAAQEFMPVSIEVGVTETRSEKVALTLLADLMKKNTGSIASAGGNFSTNLVSKSLDPPVAHHAPDPGARLEFARARYFDSLVDFKLSKATGDSSDAGRRLAAAVKEYNAARKPFGLAAIP